MKAADQILPVLVVDDSAVARKLVVELLPPDQYSLQTARSGTEALELCARSQPAIIITDWLMPGCNGDELCREIRENYKNSYTYIILLTTLTGNNQMVKALEAGADDYIAKPFVPEELLARLAVGRRIMCLHRDLEAKSHLLEQLALTDELTGLPNRRAVDEWAARQISGAIRHAFPFTVVVADLDHFKSVNDRYGHIAGDLVLKKFAEILEGNVRHCDICGRIGGEEFVVIMTHVETAGVELAVERIRKRIEQQKFRFGGQDIQVTSSFGIAELRPGTVNDFNGLVAMADAALYCAKRLGRNRIELAEMQTQ